MRRLRLALVGLAFAAVSSADDEIPLVGRPADLPFSGASAGFDVANGREYRCPFTLETAVSSSDVEEHQPITLTITARAASKVRRPPSRLDLRELPALARRFHIEDITDGKTEQLTPSAWRWVYRLRPKAAGVEAVPGVPFVFYNPDLRPPEKAFQVIWSDPLPLRVRPSERDAPPVAASRDVLTLAPVFIGATEWRFPLIGWFAVGLVPPALCVWLYPRWRRRAPDVTILRRSQAAKNALRALDLAGDASRPSADRVAAAVAGYLADRFGLLTAEVTPFEAAECLRAHGVADELGERAGRLLDRAGAVRFGPDEAALAEEAKGWVLAIEEALCPSSS